LLAFSIQVPSCRLKSATSLKWRPGKNWSRHPKVEDPCTWPYPAISSVPREGGLPTRASSVLKLLGVNRADDARTS
jgi:hypothetical protein